MTKIEYSMPTTAELRAIEARAHQLRSEAFADMLRSFGRWLAHPRLSLHASRA